VATLTGGRRGDVGPGDGGTAPLVDPRAVRVALAPGTADTLVAPMVVAPPAVPLGGVSGAPNLVDTAEAGQDGFVVVDGVPIEARLERLDAVHAVLVAGSGAAAIRRPVIMVPPEPDAGSATGVVRREVIVDGWRIELDLESERRASLLERARRGREATAHDGPTEVRAIIPGRVVAVSIAQGDAVIAGQQLLVVEAMKMQNELRAPRDGVIEQIAVGTGSTIEVGDLLLVLA
jgi:biotin carboxyl carrier protein